ncbi:hypothetical protein C8R45DRAFT_413116 [Mycena sanguinolenta]|nr:hypothetical protein C8R45DRAFT_413116 [Mycena sanguinolenta]
MTAFSTEAPTLDNTLGAVFLGVVVSCILFGVSALQVYYYYHYYPNDSLLHKVAVGTLWVLDTTHLALSIASAYHYGVSGFGQRQGLEVIVWPIKLQIALNVVIILLVHSLYAYRVWLLSGYHHGVLGYLVAGVVLGGFGIGMVLAYETYTVDYWSDTTKIAWAVESSFATSSTIDIIISVAMCYYLRKSMGGEGLLNSRISTLMQYTLSCGIFTSACSVSCLFTFLLMPNNLVFLALSYLLIRLYVNSFMAMMNARDRRPRNDSTLILSHHISSVAFTNSSSSPRSPGDLESLPTDSRSDKYDWVDVPVPAPSLSSAGTYVPSLHTTSKQTHAYSQRW